jgi:hypothetical protein
MEQMIRKQIYIRKQQDILLKRLAKARGVSEAEVIRQFIEQHENGGHTQVSVRYDPQAWARAKQFMLSLRPTEPADHKPHHWTREQAYEDRLSRYERNTD